MLQNVNGPAKPTRLIATARKSEYQWLEHMQLLLENEELFKGDYLSWAAYFASLGLTPIRPVAISALLPLFHENAHSAAFIAHSMKIVKESTAYLNPETGTNDSNGPDFVCFSDYSGQCQTYMVRTSML